MVGDEADDAFAIGRGKSLCGEERQVIGGPASSHGSV
jgi:hypothetical protein